MKKKLPRILAIVLVLASGAMVGLRSWVSGWVNRPKLVAEMEAGWNCRAELNSTSLSLYSVPARVVLGGLHLAPRDEETDKPLMERSAFDQASALLSAGRIELTVSLSDLLRRKASVRRLRIDDLILRDVTDEEGESQLDILFESPDLYEDVWETSNTGLRNQLHQVQPWRLPVSAGILSPAQAKGVDGKPPAAAKEIKPGSTGERDPKSKPKKKRRKKKKEHKPFKAADLRLALEAEEAGVENAHIELIDLGQHTRILFERVRLALKDVDVAPDDLANHNVCRLEIGGDIRLEKTDVAQMLVNCSLTGAGTIKPFDVTSGEWSPDITMDLSVRKGSLLGGTLLKEQMRKKDAEKLKEYGIDLGDVALGGELREDVDTQVHLIKGKLIVKKDTRLIFPQYEIALKGGSWFHGRSDAHIASGELVVGAELSARILAQAEKILAVELKSEALAMLAVQAVKTVLQDDNEQMVIKFKSKGKLSKPEVAWDNPLNDLKDIISKKGEDLLKDILNKNGSDVLNGLFGK